MNEKKRELRNQKRKRRILRIVYIVICFIFLCRNHLVLANLEDNEKINLLEIEKAAIQTVSAKGNEPKVNSRIAVIYDRASGKVMYGKNENKQTPMASTTKILTSIVVVENSNLSDIVTVDGKAAGTGGSRLGLKKNDKITVHDLLYGLMLCSGNDAAVALANYIGGSVEGFSKMMNQKAEELGLTNSHFVVPHGLDMEKHYTTAYELAKMADYALNIKKIKEIVGTKTYTVTINGKPRIISNTNELLGNLNGVYGVKTGFTNGAGRCLVTSCKRDELDIITVVIGADTKKIRTTDSITLIEYAYKNYQLVDIKETLKEEFEEWKKLNQNRIIIEKRIKNSIELEVEELNYEKMAIKNTQVDNIHIEINSLYYFEAPVEKHRLIGNIKIMLDDKVIDVLPIYNQKEIEKKQIKHYMLDFLKIING